MKKRYAGNILLGVTLFAYLQYRLGLRESAGALFSADGGLLAAAVGAFLLSQGVRVLKWRFFHRVAGIGVSIAGVARFYFQIKFFGILTPGRLGEFVPALTSRRRRGPLVSFTAYDRLTESMATLAVAIVAFTHLLRGVLSIDLLALALGLAAGIALLSFFCYRNEWMMGLARRIGVALAPFRRWHSVERLLDSEKRIALEIRNLQRSFRRLFALPVAALVAAITLVAVAADLLFWWLVFRTVGIELAPSVLVAAVAIFNVSGFFSPTPAGIGISDTAFVIFLRSAGVTGPFGSFVILLRLILYVVTGLCYLSFRHVAPVPPRR